MFIENLDCIHHSYGAKIGKREIYPENRRAYCANNYANVCDGLGSLSA